MNTRFYALILAAALCTTPLAAQTQAPASVQTFHITPLRPVDDLRRDALAATPPKEDGKLPPDLVELNRLDATIHLDVRYASANNFIGTDGTRSVTTVAVGATRWALTRGSVDSICRVAMSGPTSMSMFSNDSRDGGTCSVVARPG